MALSIVMNVFRFSNVDSMLPCPCHSSMQVWFLKRSATMWDWPSDSDSSRDLMNSLGSWWGQFFSCIVALKCC